MAGTKAGGLKAAATNKELYGDHFYRTIGRPGGTKSRGGGFTDREFASAQGKKGGAKSRRGPRKLTPEHKAALAAGRDRYHEERRAREYGDFNIQTLSMSPLASPKPKVIVRDIRTRTLGIILGASAAADAIAYTIGNWVGKGK